MLIESKLRRTGGTLIPMGDTQYHFKPVGEADKAPHVAEVEDEAHIERFLSITEAFRQAEAEPAAEPASATQTATPAAPARKRKGA